jgi:hypothetical protein
MIDRAGEKPRERDNYWIVSVADRRIVEAALADRPGEWAFSDPREIAPPLHQPGIVAELEADEREIAVLVAPNQIIRPLTDHVEDRRGRDQRAIEKRLFCRAVGDVHDSQMCEPKRPRTSRVHREKADRRSPGRETRVRDFYRKKIAVCHGPDAAPTGCQHRENNGFPKQEGGRDQRAFQKDRLGVMVMRADAADSRNIHYRLVYAAI